MKLSDIPAAIEGIGAELRLATRRLELRNLLADHDDALLHEIQFGGDDFRDSSRIYAGCGCARISGKVERCSEYIAAQDELQGYE